mmetsp:Transcript_13592/g.19976  ORF Transcript_13592/g.19976 Transcript_13592/m.19976 type:complete len:238 (+) Transcript_13592:740-1453(+)
MEAPGPHCPHVCRVHESFQSVKGVGEVHRAPQDRVHWAVWAVARLVHEGGQVICHGLLQEAVVAVTRGPPKKAAKQRCPGHLPEPLSEGTVASAPGGSHHSVGIVERSIPLVRLHLQEPPPTAFVQGVGHVVVVPKPVVLEQVAGFPHGVEVPVELGHDFVGIHGEVPVGHGHGGIYHLQRLLKGQGDANVVVEEANPLVEVVTRVPGPVQVQAHKIGHRPVLIPVDLLPNMVWCHQ